MNLVPSLRAGRGPVPSHPSHPGFSPRDMILPPTLAVTLVCLELITIDPLRFVSQSWVDGAKMRISAIRDISRRGVEAEIEMPRGARAPVLQH